MTRCGTEIPVFGTVGEHYLFANDPVKTHDLEIYIYGPQVN